MNRSEFERHLSAYIDDELTVEIRLEMEAFMDSDEAARAEFESHQATWEAAQSSVGGAAPDGLWDGIEAALGTEGKSETSMDDLALMMRGLAGEVQDLRREVQQLRSELAEGEWEEGREAVGGDIRVRSTIVTDRPRRGTVEQLRKFS